MVSFQMSDNLLHLKEKAVSIGNKSKPPFTAERFLVALIDWMMAADGTMSVEVRKRINCILKEQMQETVRLISENKDRIDLLVKELLAKNHLNAAEIEAALA